MNSIGKECNELKIKYDECFQVWFSEKFLKGDTNDDMCKPIFNVYRDCVRVSFTDLYFCILKCGHRASAFVLYCVYYSTKFTFLRVTD